MDNLEKLATLGTQDTRHRQTTTTTTTKNNTICVGPHYAQAKTNNVTNFVPVLL